MEDELVNNQQEEEAVDEQTTVDETAAEQAVDETQDEATDNATEVYENEEDYLAKFEFAKGKKSLDEAMSEADRLARDYDMLKRQIEAQRYQPPPEPPKPKMDATQQYLARNIYTEQVETAIKSGQVRQEDQAGLRAFASMYDRANNAVIDKMEDGLVFLAQRVQQQEKILRDQSWTLSPREVKEIGRDNLDKIMDTYHLDDYRKAANIYVAQNDPELLTRLATTAQKRGQEQARAKLKRFSSAPRSKPADTAPGVNFKPYLTPDGHLDATKLARITTDHALKVTEAYEKYLTSKSN